MVCIRLSPVNFLHLTPQSLVAAVQAVRQLAPGSILTTTLVWRPSERCPGGWLWKHDAQALQFFPCGGVARRRWVIERETRNIPVHLSPRQGSRLVAPRGQIGVTSTPLDGGNRTHCSLSPGPPTVAAVGVHRRLLVDLNRDERRLAVLRVLREEH